MSCLDAVRRLASLLFLAGVLTTSAAGAQSCDPCIPLKWELTATLGALRDPVSPSYRSTIATDGERFIVSPLDGVDHEIAVYRGSTLLRTIGRAGDGPGEYAGIQYVQYDGESFHIFSGGRETILDELEPVSTKRLGMGPLSVAVIDRDVSIIEASQVDRSQRVLRLFRVTADTMVAFGPVVRMPLNYASGVGSVRILGQAPEATFWVGQNDRYEFVKWSREGVAVDSLTLPTPDWFDPFMGDPTEMADLFQQRPHSIVKAIREDEDGLLWVASYDSRADWVPRAVGPGREERQLLLPSVYDTVIDVIDVARRRVIASTRIPGLVISFPASGVAVARRTAEYGLVQLLVLQFQSPFNHEEVGR